MVVPILTCRYPMIIHPKIHICCREAVAYPGVKILQNTERVAMLREFPHVHSCEDGRIDLPVISGVTETNAATVSWRSSGSEWRLWL